MATFGVASHEVFERPADDVDQPVNKKRLRELEVEMELQSYRRQNLHEVFVQTGEGLA